MISCLSVTASGRTDASGRDHDGRDAASATAQPTVKQYWVTNFFRAGFVLQRSTCACVRQSARSMVPPGVVMPCPHGGYLCCRCCLLLVAWEIYLVSWCLFHKKKNPAMSTCSPLFSYIIQYTIHTDRTGLSPQRLQ